VFSAANGNAISVSDADAGDDEQVTLTATNGTLTFGGIPGLTTVSIKTSLAVINNALNGLLLTPTPGYAGAADLTITGAGAVVVRASQAGNASYNAAPAVDQSIVIDPAPLSISADNKIKFINTANPVLTASYDGLVYGESASVLDIQVSLATTAATDSPIGNYPITASGAVNPNYTITFTQGTLTVTQFRFNMASIRK
jgi:hypothetical protein